MRSFAPDSKACARRLTTMIVVQAVALCLISHVAVASPPNILLIIADDQAPETIGALGLTDIDTPNLDRLVESGTVFNHTYNMGGWHGAICVASRTMLNTGRFLWGARDAENTLGRETERRRMWSQMLEDAGYATYFTGKWHVRADAKKLFQNVGHVRPGMPGAVAAGYNRPIKGQPDEWSPSDPKFGGFWQGGRHWSMTVADTAEGFLEQAKESEDPFFMYLAFNAPHDPRQSPQEYVDRYPLDRIELPPNYLPEYPHARGIGAGPDLRDERLAPFPRTEYAVKVNRAEYYALITFMDTQIGRILDALEATGKADNTIIIFTADHGLGVGQHGLLGKQNMYEHSLRVPMILSGPGIDAGGEIDARVYYQDIVPTTLELAGIEVPEQVDYKSLWPLIRGEQDELHDVIYAAYRPDRQRAVIRDGFKLIHYPSINVFRLFHLADDPHEMKDLIDSPDHADTVAMLKQTLVETQRAMGDPLVK